MKVNCPWGLQTNDHAAKRRIKQVRFEQFQGTCLHYLSGKHAPPLRFNDLQWHLTMWHRLKSKCSIHKL